MTETPKAAPPPGASQARESHGALWLVLPLLVTGLLVVGLLTLNRARLRDEVGRLLDTGMAQYQDQDFEAARRTFRRALELDPKRGLAWQYLADIARIRGRHDEEERLLLKAIEVDPLTAAFPYKLAYLYFMQGKYQESESHLRRALKLDPKAQYLMLSFALGDMQKLPREELVRRLRSVIVCGEDQCRTLLEAGKLIEDRTLAPVWAQAARRLLDDGDTYGLDRAEKLLASDQPALRLFAVRVLANVGRPEALAALQTHRDDPDAGVRQAVQEALAPKSEAAPAQTEQGNR